MPLRHLTFLIIFLVLFIPGNAQNEFFSKSVNIELLAIQHKAVNARTRSATALLDTKTGGFVFSVLVKSFEFEKAAMQEHFNGQYMESDKYPKAEFKGAIENNTALDYTKDGNYS